MNAQSRNVRWFDTVGIEDVPLVGGKNASLGELYRALGTAGVRVPNGFALTAGAYTEALTQAGVWPRLHELLDKCDVTDMTMLAERRGRGAQFRDRRGSADREFRRPARKLPQCRGAEDLFEACRRASPRCSPIARSSIGSTTASITSRSALSVGVMKMVRSDRAAAA
jgi:hypothetical protein